MSDQIEYLDTLTKSTLTHVDHFLTAEDSDLLEALFGRNHEFDTIEKNLSELHREAKGAWFKAPAGPKSQVLGLIKDRAEAMLNVMKFERVVAIKFVDDLTTITGALDALKGMS